MQVHLPGRRTLQLGQLCQVLSQHGQPHHRVRRVGQVRQGLEPDQLQAEAELESWSVGAGDQEPGVGIPTLH